MDRVGCGFESSKRWRWCILWLFEAQLSQAKPDASGLRKWIYEHTYNPFIAHISWKAVPQP